MTETIQIDKRLTLDVEYEYHAGISAISEAGGPITIPAEPAHIEIHTVSIYGSAVMYSKKLWAELQERIIQDYE